jgi:hypothetical protein
MRLRISAAATSASSAEDVIRTEAQRTTAVKRKDNFFSP